MYEQEKQRVIHLIILIFCTIFAIILIGESLLLGWETGAVVLIFFGVIASWGVYITEKFSASIRVWTYFVVTMLAFFFYGIHESSIFDLAPVMIFIIILFSAAEIGMIINFCLITYYFTMAYDFVVLLKGSVELNALSVTRTALHLVLVYTSGYMVKNVMKRHVKERKETEIRIAELEEINLRTEDFLTNVSHELRTPINVVTGVTAVMMKSEEDAGKRKDILSIQMAGQRLFGQIEDILDFTEIDTGRIKVSEDAYMISSIINDIISGKSLMERDNKTELIFDIDAGIPSELIGDGRKIKKIIKHLVGNALKFTKKGGVYVRLYTIPKPYGVNLCIKVCDTGIGIDAENMEKITEKFFQTNGGRNRNAGGLGLGLSIVFGMVSAMEGFIQIGSSKENGTEVSVSIPQKVLDKSPCMEVENRSDLCLACFLKTEKYAVPQVRDYYNETITHMLQGLNVSLHRVADIEELESLFKRYQLSHLVIGKEEYEENTEYFEYLDESTQVIVIADDSLELPQKSRIKLLRKPFYCLPIVNILNSGAGKKLEQFERKNMLCPGVRVLVVDDEPMNLMVAEGIFKDYEMKVKTVGSGMEAIDICGKEEFDLIFLDHMMPEMDGVETMKHLRQIDLDAGKLLTIIAFTANAVSGAREMFLREGFDEFVSKPIEDLELERVLRKVLPKQSIIFVDENEAAAKKEERQAAEGKESREALPDKEQPQKDKMELLEGIGINTRSGMQYSRRDKDFYEELLVKFGKDEKQKASEMDDLFQKEDLANYRIRVHALKSTAKMVGADSLSEMAKMAEEAAKENDVGYIREHHGELIVKYHELSQQILQIFYMDENDTGETAGEDLTEISDSSLIQCLNELKEGLDTFEADKAESLLAKMSGMICRDIPVEKLLKDIKQDVEDFEFAAAAEKTEALIGKMEGGEAL